MTSHLEKRNQLIIQFQFCVDRVAEALGGVCCGGVDSSPEEQMKDPHSTTRVLCDAIKKLKLVTSQRKTMSPARFKEKEMLKKKVVAASNEADEFPVVRITGTHLKQARMLYTKLGLPKDASPSKSFMLGAFAAQLASGLQDQKELFDSQKKIISLTKNYIIQAQKKLNPD
jgi:hypothetical protein